MINCQLKIIAGPCSVDEDNLKEIWQIADLKVNGYPAVFGTRVVGLKSRTIYHQKGEGMGIDFESFKKNLFSTLAESSKKYSYPSVKIAKEIVKKTHLIVATEVMEPVLQLPFYEKKVFQGRLFIWNPAVNQLGWPILIMGELAKKNNWWIGLKNPKWVGENLKTADLPSFTKMTTMEKTWEGLVTYSSYKEKTVLIHRGVDVAEKGDYRNAPVHQIAKRVKQRTGCQLFFDPSHSYGPKLRGDIVKATIEAMKMMASDKEFLYDGILIEVGTSKTDTEQHISLEELKFLVNQLARFRVLEINPD